MGANILLSPEDGKLVSQAIPIASLAELLSDQYLHHTVLDKTGLTDTYDFSLESKPEESQPALLAAIQEQLGLKLEPQTAPVDVLVIDHAEKPVESQARDATPAAPAFESGSINRTHPAAPYALKVHPPLRLRA